MPSRNVYNLGSLRGFGSSTRIYNFCRQTSPAPWTCIDQFTENVPAPPAPPLPPGFIYSFKYFLNKIQVEKNLSIIEVKLNDYTFLYHLIVL